MKAAIATFLVSMTIGLHAIAATVLDCKGTFVHRSELFSFPEKIGSFKREAITQFDQDGDDIGGAYRCPESESLLITIYAYPAPKTRDGKPATFEEVVRAEYQMVMSNTAGTKAMSWPKGVPMWSDEGVRGALLAFDLGGTGQHTSLLQLYDYGPWALKFRTTYRGAEVATSERQIDAFHRAFLWPQKKSKQAAPIQDQDADTMKPRPSEMSHLLPVSKTPNQPSQPMPLKRHG